jgi:hypothetical protein
MADNENLGDVKNKLVVLRHETREGLSRVGVRLRLGFVEQALASMRSVSTSGCHFQP